MATITGEILIHRPVEEVFDVVIDKRNEPAYPPRMLRANKLIDGLIGVGTRFRCTVTSPSQPPVPGMPKASW
ncbi:hypothetical protein [Rhodococcus aetherivorans]|uniref:hypothetical protein n=1 Tax=Rhodococcus aetherivorans TaxID=191292 RepID=UPI0038903A90